MIRGRKITFALALTLTLTLTLRCAEPGDDGAAFLRSRCVIVLREGMKWGSLVNLTRGAIARRGYEHVALLLDDVKLGDSFNATELVHLSRTRKHTAWGVAIVLRQS